MNEITIKNLNDLQELDDFIATHNEKVDAVKGLVVATDADIKIITKNLKDLKDREGILKIAEGKLIKLVGIDRIGIAIANSSKHRLDVNKNVQIAKQNIKNNAINYFIKNATELIAKSQAHVVYKASFDLKKLALETIAGKSKDLIGAMKTELGNLGLMLDNNARETREKLAIINKYDIGMVRDSEYLLSLPVELLEQTLENRKREQDLKVKNEAKKLADAIEAERLEAERLAKIEAERLSKYNKLFGSKVQFKNDVHSHFQNKDFCLIGFSESAIAVIEWEKRGEYDCERVSGSIDDLIFL